MTDERGGVPARTELANPSTLEYATDATLRVEPFRRETRISNRLAARDTLDEEAGDIARQWRPSGFQNVHLVRTFFAMKPVPFEEPDRSAADGLVEELKPSRQSERRVMTKREVDDDLGRRDERAKTEGPREQRTRYLGR